MFTVVIPRSHINLADELETLFMDGLREIGRGREDTLAMSLPLFNIINTCAGALARLKHYEPATANKLDKAMAEAVPDIGVALSAYDKNVGVVLNDILLLQARIQAAVLNPEKWNDQGRLPGGA